MTEKGGSRSSPDYVFSMDLSWIREPESLRWLLGYSELTHNVE